MHTEQDVLDNLVHFNTYELLMYKSYTIQASADAIMKRHFIDVIKKDIEKWNEAYRTGHSLVDDQTYDNAVELLDSLTGEQMEDTHAEVANTSRKQQLPVSAASMDKCKSIDELRDWCKSKGIDFDNTVFVFTPKFDGITLIVEEDFMPEEKNDPKKLKVWTKGRKGKGLFSALHFSMMFTGDGLKAYSDDDRKFTYSRGEAIIKKSIFEANYSKYRPGGKPTDFENPRNMVSGKFTDENASPAIMAHIDYIRFHAEIAGDGMDKVQMLKILNEANHVPIPFVTATGSEFSDEFFDRTFDEFSRDYEIDGLIIEVNDHKLREKLGYHERSGNPNFARAYKGGDKEDFAETTVVSIQRQISKQGYFKPVVITKPVRLNGVTVTNFYADNERWLMAYGVGVGSTLTVKRSGMVIPRIAYVEKVKVLDAEPFSDLCDKYWDVKNPNKLREVLGTANTSLYMYPQELKDGAARWNNTNIEVELVNENDEMKIQKLIAFYEIIGAEGISDGTIIELYNKNARTVGDINALAFMGTQVMAEWDGWGVRSAEIVSNSIKKALAEATLPKLMHASSCFKGLGSTKLEWVLAKYPDIRESPTYDQVLAIDGYQDTSVKAYLSGLEKFRDFCEDNNIIVPNYTVKVVETTGDKLVGKQFVWTGFRDAEGEGLVITNGGTVGSGVSKNTHYLIVKKKGSGSSKEKKAEQLGVVILDRDEFYDLIKNL